MKLKLKHIIGIVLVAALFFGIPQVLEGYYMSVVNVAMLFAIVAFGISVLLGMGGQLSFAAVTFMGLGAYFMANITTGRIGGFTMPAVLGLVLAPFIFAGVAFLVGLVLLKLKGTYFTFATIALVQVSFTYFNNFAPLFGGVDGIPGIPPLEVFGYRFTSFNSWFYVIAAGLIVVALIVERIRRSQLGRALSSIRDNETAALTFGVNTYITKVIAFSIAGGFAAFGGALWVMHGRFVGPDMFNFVSATQFIIMAMLGGVNSTIGIIIGAGIVVGLPEFFRAFQGYMQLFWGIAIIVLMVFMPTGLAGIKDWLVEKMKKQKARSKKQEEEKSDETSTAS